VIAAIGLLLGVGLGLLVQPEVPTWLQPYLPIAVVAALDATFGGLRALLDGIYADARREESERLAHAVQRTLVRRLQADSPGITDRGVKTAPFVVLVATDMPAILAEVSCLSNADEADRLATPAYRQTIAESLALGIQTFIDHKNTPPIERKSPSES